MLRILRRRGESGAGSRGAWSISPRATCTALDACPDFRSLLSLMSERGHEERSPQFLAASAQPARSRWRNAAVPAARNPPAIIVNHTIQASLASGPGSTGEWVNGLKSITH